MCILKFCSPVAALAIAVSLFNVGCSRQASSHSPQQESSQALKAGGEVAEKHALPPHSAQVESDAVAVGASAPSFTLKNLAGDSVSLSSFQGKTVVLEWFNPGCPYVKAAHTRGPLKGLAEQYVQGGDVVWLAINSGGKGRQGYGTEANKAGVQRFGIQYPVLLDETGTVGKAYGATNTPHMYIINQDGILVYRGAPDNSPDGEGESPQGGPLVNYVVQALQEIAEGKPVSVAETDAYGCSVKYASR